MELNQPLEIVKKWESAGNDAECFLLLPFAPLLEVAWAEGFLQAGERRTILDLYNHLEITADEVYNQLVLYLNERPTEEFFATANEILAEWLTELPEIQRNNLKKFLHLGCLRVATASSKISLTPDVTSICQEERHTLEKIGNRFGFSLA